MARSKKITPQTIDKKGCNNSKMPTIEIGKLGKDWVIINQANTWQTTPNMISAAHDCADGMAMDKPSIFNSTN